jgi:8-oxo-dGTP pyrophosphatase MutT (NUDIX family)
MVPSSIQRVVSCFILTGGPARQDLAIAIFHRVATMPTFPSRWAACSGSIEEGETPWETCRRELMEETNLSSVLAQPNQHSGLYVDVSLASNSSKNNSHENRQERPTRTIRVYPFTVEIPKTWDLQLRGTEHDRFQWVSVDQLEHYQLLELTVPSLATAFHHATAGRYLTSVARAEQEWASDRSSGAATMARRAVELLLVSPDQADPTRMIMMRPSMVAIVNALQPIIQGKVQAKDVLESLQKETDRPIDYATLQIVSLCRDLRNQQQRHQQRPLRIATHSRSSTLLAVLERVLSASDDDFECDNNENGNDGNCNNKIPLIQRPILCGQSIPGNEGELLARDLSSSSSSSSSSLSLLGSITAETATCVDDDTLCNLVASGDHHVDLLLVGADCICQNAIVNKVGTKRLAQAAASAASGSRCQVVCCADRFKLWDDVFPPPLEDIF